VSVTVQTEGERRRFPLVEGIEIQPVVGARMNINVVTLEPESIAPVHTHDEEQIGYVVSGTCSFTDGGAVWDLGPGDSYHCAPNAPHGATAGSEGCVIIDAFTPPRAGVRELLGG